MKDQLSILIPTCDSYSNCWEGLGLSWDILSGLNLDTFVVSDSLNFNYEGKNFIPLNINKPEYTKYDFSNKIIYALDKIKTLNGVTFNWENNIFKTERTNDIGVIAQEVQSVLPEAVALAPFDIDSEGNSKSGENYLTVYYEKLIPLLIEGIKELKAENDTLKEILQRNNIQ